MLSSVDVLMTLLYPEGELLVTQQQTFSSKVIYHLNMLRKKIYSVHTRLKFVLTFLIIVSFGSIFLNKYYIYFYFHVLNLALSDMTFKIKI